MSINYIELNKILNLLTQYQKSELLIVTKNRDQKDIQSLIQKGHNLFGENRVQEAKKKYELIKKDSIKLHLIGPLQTNKVKDALQLFDVIQTLDRPKLIDEIFNYISHNTKVITRDFYIQVNIGNEIQKSGVAPKELKDFYNYAKLKKLNVVGLMCIPPVSKLPDSFFTEMVNLKNKINQNLKLSMGMSSDYEVALKRGSDLIRVGSKIFN